MAVVVSDAAAVRPLRASPARRRAGGGGVDGTAGPGRVRHDAPIWSWLGAASIYRSFMA